MLLLALLLSAALPAHAQVTLKDMRLRQQAIRLERLDEQAIVYFDEQGNLQAKALSGYVQMSVTASEDEASASNTETSETRQDAPTTQPAAPLEGTLLLIDGQRLPGSLIEVIDEGQTLHWRHPMAGVLAVPMDHISRFARVADDPPAAPAGTLNDHLKLANGDALQGYVAAITTTALVFEPQGVNQRIELPWAQISSFTLANAPAAHEQPVTMLTLADGSVLQVRSCTIELGKVMFRPWLVTDGGEPATCELSQVARIDFANDRVRLMRLRDLPWRVTAGGQAFAAPLPVRLSRDAMHLHAPLTLTLDLPQGALAVTAAVSLDIAQDDPALPWADVAVSLASDDTASSASAALSADRTSAVLHTRVSGSRLVLTLDPALNGPIMDRVKLTDAWVAVERK